jgi:hypothetical protein
VTREHPEADCNDLAFRAGYPLDEPAEVALEDYCRVLTRARGAEAVRVRDEPSMVRGVHVCGLGTTLTNALLTDMEDFARDLSLRAGGGGLGWS